ncbi:MAG: PQQ-like beta-propeller repeat protein [Akkermansiaceae bacterium]|nr:PQQ-like beta-propeller repeat protein [Akkermansiaceae bacterium]
MQTCRWSLLLALFLPISCVAGDWPQWRGPAGNGSADERNLPDSCDPATAKWTTPLPGASHATPVIAGKRLFLTATDRPSKGVLAICLDPADGKILWQRRIGDDIKAPQNNGATPSPVTDGRSAWFLLGSGALVALDMEGKLLWQRDLANDHGNLCTKFGYSSSPLLWRDTLYVQILRRTKPYSGEPGIEGPLEPLVLALDPASGREKWQHVRKSDAVDESLEAYTSPVAFENGEHSELLIEGGDFISGHDPATGAEIWRCEYNPERKSMWRLIPSPVVAGGLIVATLPRGGPMWAFKPGGKGRLDPSSAVWVYDERTSDSGTPLYYQNLLYILQSDKNDPWSRGSKSSPGIFLLVLDPATGKEVGRTEIAKGGAWRSSPTGADGKIYLMSEKGEVVVVAAGVGGRILSRANFDDGPACATIVVANGRVFVRTADKLSCFGK